MNFSSVSSAQVNGRRARDREIDTTSFCQPIADGPINIPLRVKKTLSAGFLADSRYHGRDTAVLIGIARAECHVYVTDRASAIAVLESNREASL